MLNARWTNKKLLLRHKINDLLIHDPNQNVLRGNKLLSQAYYLACGRLQLHGDPLEKVAEYIDKMVPYVWNPTLPFFSAYLDMISEEKAPQFLPKLWTDVVASQFGKNLYENRINFCSQFAEAMLKIVNHTHIDENLKKTLDAISKDIFKELQINYGYDVSDRKPLVNKRIYEKDSELCKNLLILSMDQNNFSLSLIHI